MSITLKLTEQFTDTVRRDPAQFFDQLPKKICSFDFEEVFPEASPQDRDLYGIFSLYCAPSIDEAAAANAIKDIPGVEYAHVAPGRKSVVGAPG